ncbi:MAG: serine hydrolase domain-containing protein [Flavobacteriaceae bacterium]
MNSHGQTRTEKLHELIENYKEYYGFSGTVLYAKGEELIYQESFGLADREQNIPNTNQGAYAIYNLNRIFLSSIAMKLVENSQLDLKANVGTYLPELPEQWKNLITIEMLLGNTAGFSRNWPTQELKQINSASFEQIKLVHYPGSRYNFSIVGMQLLALIVEQVSDKSYGDLLKKTLVKPLSLKHTGAVNQLKKKQVKAQGYYMLPQGLVKAEPVNSFGSTIYSNPEDLWRFSLSFEEDKVLSTSSTERIFKKNIKSNDSEFEGYGWSIKLLLQEPVYFVNSGGPGYKNLLVKIPDTKEVIVISANSNESPVLQLFGGIFRLIRGQEYLNPNLNEMIPAKEAKTYIGIYNFSPGSLYSNFGIQQDQLEITLVDGRLYLEGELLIQGNGGLKLSISDELKINIAENKLIISDNRNSLQGAKRD